MKEYTEKFIVEGECSKSIHKGAKHCLNSFYSNNRIVIRIYAR